MKILVITQHYYPETFSINLICEALHKKGHDVTVVTGIPNYGKQKYYDGYDKKPRQEVINGVKVIRCKESVRKTSKLSYLHNYHSFYKSSRKQIKKMDGFDVVYSMCLSPITSVSAGNLYCKKNPGIKHIHHCVDVWPDSAVEVNYVRKNSIFYKIILQISKKIYSKMDNILVSSYAFIDYFNDVIGIEKSKIKFVPQVAYDVEQVPGEIKFDHKYNIVYAGNIGKIQKIDEIVKYLKDAKINKDLMFHILGDGSELNSLLKAIKENHLENIVTYHGKVNPNEVGKWYRNATALFVSLPKGKTVVSDTISNKFVTYMIYEKPIIGILSNKNIEILSFNKNCFKETINKKNIESIFNYVCDYQNEIDVKHIKNTYNSIFNFENIINDIEKSFVNK